MKIIKVYFILIVLGFISSSVFSSTNNPPVKLLKFRVYDADTDREIGANLYIDGERITDNKYILIEGAESQIGIEVKIDAGESYKARSFVVFLEGMKNSTIPYNIYVAQHKPDAMYNIGSIDPINDWVRFGGQSPDKAVVLLERIKESKSASKISKISSFHVYLNHVLAGAYLKNCTLRYVDQCESATEIYEELRNNFDDYNSIMKSMRITKESLSYDTNQFYLPLLYKKASWEVACGRFEKAIELYNELIYKLEKNPQYEANVKVGMSTIKAARSSVERKLNRSTVVGLQES